MTLKVLTIGAGYFAGFHVEAWSRNPETTLVGIVDKDEDKAKALGATHAPKTHCFKNAASAIQATEPDIIDIATPPDTHQTLISLADQAAPKAIICQKPFCGNLDTAKTVTAATKSTLIVHENFRFQPWYRVIKQQLIKSTLGELYQITFRLRPGDGQGPDAYLARQPYFQDMERFLIHETAIHWIDTFRYLMGEPTAVFADLRQINAAIKGEDAGHVLFKFAGNKRALFDGNRASDHAADNTRLTMGDCLIEGSKGTLTLDGFGRLNLRAIGHKTSAPIEIDFDPNVFGGDCVYAFQKHVSDHLAHGIALENSAQDYLKNLQIEESIYRSANDNKLIEL